MKLTSRGRYTLQALFDLINHSNGKAVKLQDISKRQNISLHYLEQLFRRLRINGIVKSVRGPGGGYVLAKTTSDITISEILAGVKELTNYSNSLKISEETTIEQQTLAKYLNSFDHAIKTCLNKKLNDIL